MFTNKKINKPDDDYLSRLFKKYSQGVRSTANDGVDGLSCYPDGVIWDLRYMFKRFGNEEALNLKNFLSVPGVKEIFNAGALSYGEMLKCFYLKVEHAERLVAIYNENKEIWNSATKPRLGDLIFKGRNDYDVATIEEAREIAHCPSNINEFARTHERRVKPSYIQNTFLKTTLVSKVPIDDLKTKQNNNNLSFRKS